MEEISDRLDQERNCCEGCGYAGPLCPVLMMFDLYCCLVPSVHCCPCFDYRVIFKMKKACEELSKNMGTLELRVLSNTACTWRDLNDCCYPMAETRLSFLIARREAAAAPAQLTMERGPSL